MPPGTTGPRYAPCAAAETAGAQGAARGCVEGLKSLGGRCRGLDVFALLNSGKARQRADDLQGRLRRRMDELEQERQLSPSPPVVVGGAVVIPRGLLERLRGERKADPTVHAKLTERVERLAVGAVMATERALGRAPREMPRNNPGFDILSKDPATGGLFFIEVKGRVEGAPTVTVTKNEILTGLNKRDQFVLALVAVADDETTAVRYLPAPFVGSEDAYFDVTSVDYEWGKLTARATEPPGLTGSIGAG